MISSNDLSSQMNHIHLNPAVLPLILASTSQFRRELLTRLQIPFSTVAPDADETPLADESPAATAERLSELKARAVAARHPDSLIIGSDQVASIDKVILCKPGGFERAAVQLRQSAGREVRFHTAVAAVCLERSIERVDVEHYSVWFRQLTESQITHYLQVEEPYDCAGSFKVEGLGIALFDRVRGDDPTSLEGLPLIKLTEYLTDAGIDVLSVRNN